MIKSLKNPLAKQDIVNNLEKILNGEIEITYVPAFRKHLKNKGLLGEYKCKECKCGEIWNNKKLTLDLDHIDGNKFNNKKENLRWLCPNCHSQTGTWKFKNFKRRKKNKISDEEMIKSIKIGGNISQILKRVGLKARGHNYERVYKIIKDYKLGDSSRELEAL